MSEIMSPELAQRTVKRYGCAVCWGHLAMYREGPDRFRVECAKHGDEHYGFTTKYFIEKRQQESHGELVETREMLRDLGVVENPHAGKTVTDLLKEMGF